MSRTTVFILLLATCMSPLSSVFAAKGDPTDEEVARISIDELVICIALCIRVAEVDETGRLTVETGRVQSVAVEVTYGKPPHVR